MVFNGLMVVSMAHVSADAWQQLLCVGFRGDQERISSHQLLDLICCFPLEELGRLALYLWTFLCLPPPNSFFSYSYHASSSSSSDDDDDDLYHHYTHHLVPASSSSSSSVDLDDIYHHSRSD